MTIISLSDHPMSKLQRENNSLKAENQHLLDKIEWLSGNIERWNMELPLPSGDTKTDFTETDHRTADEYRALLFGASA